MSDEAGSAPPSEDQNQEAKDRTPDDGWHATWQHCLLIAQRLVLWLVLLSALVVGGVATALALLILKLWLPETLDSAICEYVHTGAAVLLVLVIGTRVIIETVKMIREFLKR